MRWPRRCERYDVAHPVLDDPELDDLAGLHRPGLADPGARRPGGLRRRAVRRRGPRARDRRAARRAARGARGQGHAAAGRLAVRPACARARRPALPGQGGPAAGRRASRRRRRPPPARRARRGRGDRGTPDRLRRPRAGRRAGRRRRRFNEPNGLCLLPDEVAARVGYDVVVADTVNHALRGIDLASPARCAPSPATAGSGCRGGTTASLSSPWDVAWWQDRVWVAMAGIHQLWTFDPVTGGGRGGRRHHQRGPGRRASRPRRGSRRPRARRRRGPAVARGQRDLLAALGRGRRRAHRSRQGPVRLRLPATVPTEEALLQHPLGVTVLPDGSRRGLRHLQRRRTPLRPEPPAAAHHRWRPGWPSPAARCSTGSTCVVVESAAHRLTRIPLVGAAPATGHAHTTQRPVTESAPGELEIAVVFAPPPGQKVDDRFGPAVAAARLRDAPGPGHRPATAAAPS